MDLDRLKIGDHQREKQGNSKLPLIVIGVIALFVGGVIGFFIPQGSNGVLKVKTIVARSSSGVKSIKSFTAGGWVEVSTPDHPIEISCRTSERIEEILVKDGDVVQPGQVLVRFYDRDKKTELELAAANLSKAESQYSMMKKGFRKEELNMAKQKVEDFKERLRIAKAHHERNAKVGHDVMSAKTIDTSLAIYKRAEAKYNEALFELKKMEAGYREEEVAMAKAEYQKVKSAHELAERHLEYCTLKVPQYGAPLKVLHIQRKVGEWVHANDKDMKASILSLYDPEKMQARVDVTQESIGAVKKGAPVIVRTDAQPNKEYKGSVLRVEPLADLAKNTISVKVCIDDPDDMLFPEMTAKITFFDKKGDVSKTSSGDITVPKSAVVSTGGKTYVFVVENKMAKKVPVKIVKQKSSSYDVTGIKFGQRIIVSNLSKVKEGTEVETIK
jgi:RND family efflux transporter MFP subunit